MKNTYTVAQRNQIVEDNLWCVDALMADNRKMIQAAHLDLDDVYQQLCLRLIHAIEAFDPEKGSLRQYIFAQLRQELWECRKPVRLCGMTELPKGRHRGDTIISLDVLRRAEARQEVYAA